MGNFVNSTDDFFKYCKDNEVEFVDLRFTDIKGTWHHLTYRFTAVNIDNLENGFPFDGSSIEAWQPIHMSDMILKPDILTAFLDPFTADPTIVVICNVFDIYKKKLYEKCPRSIAQKTIEYMNEIKIADNAYFGPENEFFIFDNVKISDGINKAGYSVDSEEGEWNDPTHYDEMYNTGHRPRTKGGYFPVQPTDSMVDIRAEMMQVLEQIGLKVTLSHHEVAQAQGEIGVVYSNLVDAADNVQKYKYVIKMVAHLNGKTATFMPKPLYGDNGSGMHVHQSLWKGEKNIFYHEGQYGNVSQTALYYAGGVFKHARAVAAFTNASTNSYKRLIPGFEAPNILTYSSKNRSAACRIPYGSNANNTRLEMRFPDSTSCPYLAFSVILLAGIDGIKNKITPVGPMDEDLFKLTLDEIRKKNIPQMPHTLRSSLESLIIDNDFLKPVFTDHLIDAYQHHKFNTQVFPDEARPTAFEFKTTYSC